MSRRDGTVGRGILGQAMGHPWLSHTLWVWFVPDGHPQRQALMTFRPPEAWVAGGRPAQTPSKIQGYVSILEELLS